MGATQDQPPAIHMRGQAREPDLWDFTVPCDEGVEAFEPQRMTLLIDSDQELRYAMVASPGHGEPAYEQWGFHVDIEDIATVIAHCGLKLREMGLDDLARVVFAASDSVWAMPWELEAA